MSSSKGEKKNMHAPTNSKTAWHRMGSSATIKLLVISTLALALLIPTSMVTSLVQERMARNAEVTDEINSKWGHPQTITGPILSIPYAVHTKNLTGQHITTTEYVHLLPDSIDIKGQVAPEVRYRSIYESILYGSLLAIECQFPSLPLKELRISPDDIIWSAAAVWIGISDLRGINAPVQGSHNGQTISMEPGTEPYDLVSSGISAAVPIKNQEASHHFSFLLSLNGSRQIDFTPVGKTTTVSMACNWKDPSFIGAFLPKERQIDDNGFSAKWQILHLNRNYPQYWKGSLHNLAGSDFGVKFFKPVDIYQKVIRTVKYALLFMAFTFCALFITETLVHLRIHPVQYLLTGFAMIIFYALLLALSEHVGFNTAYLAASLAIIGLISGYARSILKHPKASRMVGITMMLLYAYLYVVLQLEAYALLVGSTGLFAALATVMYLTRRIDWYAISQDTARLGSDPVTDAPR